MEIEDISEWVKTLPVGLWGELKIRQRVFEVIFDFSVEGFRSHSLQPVKVFSL